MKKLLLIFLYILNLEANTFVELLDKAKENDPDYLMAIENVNVAIAKKDFAHALDNPELYFKGEGRYYGYANQSLTDRPGSQPDLNEETSFWSHHVDFGLKINLYEQKLTLMQEFRELEYKKAILHLKHAHNKLVVDFIAHYLNALRSYYDYKAAQSGEIASDIGLDRYSAELNSGKKDIVEFSIAQAFAGLTTVSVQIKYDKFVNDIYALELFVGEKVSRLKLLKESIRLKRPSPSYSDEWVEKMKLENLEVLSENLTLKLAQKNLRLAQEKYAPKLTGRIAAEDKYNKRFNLIGKTHEYGAFAGVSLEIPLYTFGRSGAVIKEATALFHKEQYKKQKLQNRLSYKTKEMFLHVLSHTLQVKASKQKVLTYKNLYKLSLSQEKLGRKTSAQRLRVASDLASAEAEYEKYKCDFLLSKYNLIEIAGVIEEEEFMKLETFFAEDDIILSDVIEEE